MTRAEILSTPGGRALYGKWTRTRNFRAPEWDNFREFYSWCVGHGYEYGMLVRQKDPRSPWSPENCYFEDPPEMTPSTQKAYKGLADRWDLMVMRARKACGLPPIHDPETLEYLKCLETLARRSRSK